MTAVELGLPIKFAVLLVGGDEDVVADEDIVEDSEPKLLGTEIELRLGVLIAVLSVGGEGVDDGLELELSVRTVELRL